MFITITIYNYKRVLGKLKNYICIHGCDIKIDFILPQQR